MDCRGRTFLCRRRGGDHLVLGGRDLDDRQARDGLRGDQHGKLRVCLAATPGGHLAELETLVSATDGQERFLVTVASPHTISTLLSVRKRYVRRVVRNPVNLMLNFFQSLAIVVRERPDVVISTGAGDVLAILMISASLGIPIVFMESLARVEGPSLTGRIVRRWSSLILIPWPTLRRAYPDAVLVEPPVKVKVFAVEVPALPSTIILTGTSGRGFDRLLSEVDRLIESKRLPGHVFAQVGGSTYKPRHYAYQRFVPHDELLQRIEDCDVVITHDGAGSILEALRAGKVTIVVPRKSELGEHIWRSDAELARHLASLGWVRLVESPSAIPQALSRPGGLPANPTPLDSRESSQVVADFLRTLSHRVVRSLPLR